MMKPNDWAEGNMKRAVKAVANVATEFKEVFTAGDYRIVLPPDEYARLRRTLVEQIELLDHLEVCRRMVELQSNGQLPPGSCDDGNQVLKQFYQDAKKGVAL